MAKHELSPLGQQLLDTTVAFGRIEDLYALRDLGDPNFAREAELFEIEQEILGRLSGDELALFRESAPDLPRRIRPSNLAVRKTVMAFDSLAQTLFGSVAGYTFAYYNIGLLKTVHHDRSQQLPPKTLTIDLQADDIVHIHRETYKVAGPELAPPEPYDERLATLMVKRLGHVTQQLMAELAET